MEVLIELIFMIKYLKAVLYTILRESLSAKELEPWTVDFSISLAIREIVAMNMD